jgi:hypothetical protein
MGYGPIVKPEKGTEAPQMKNPGALAGATGADHSKYVYKTEEYRVRAECATALAEAITNCHPDDACQIMVAALCDLAPGGPSNALFLSREEDAAWWASWADSASLVAMLAAALDRLGDQALHIGMRKRLIVQLFESLPASDRIAFLKRTDPTGQFMRQVAQ